MPSIRPAWRSAATCRATTRRIATRSRPRNAQLRIRPRHGLGAALYGAGVGTARTASTSAQCGAGAWRLGGRLLLERGHRAPSGGGLACDRGAESADIARRLRRSDAPRVGAARWPDRARRPFLERYGHQRNWNGSESHRPRLRCGAGARRGRGFRRAVRKVSHHAGAGGRPGTRGLRVSFRGRFSPIFRERSFARKGGGPVCRAGTARRLALRRADLGSRLALQTELVCRVETRSDDIARSGTIPGATHESQHCGIGCGPPFAGLARKGDHRAHPGRCRPLACSSIHSWDAWIFPTLSEPGGYTMKYEYLVRTLWEKSRTSRPDSRSTWTNDARARATPRPAMAAASSTVCSLYRGPCPASRYSSPTALNHRDHGCRSS